ncbi:MAG: amino acid permease, partial [Acidobacteriota bacterium]|nr:amino acid permease [Acidobacteriota bacterium]
GLMYVVVILATASVMPWEKLVASRPTWATGTTVHASLGSMGVTLLAVAVVAAVATGLNGFYMATSRLLFSMGRARLLPGWFSRVHSVHGTPTNAIVFTAVVSLVAPWFGRQVLSWIVDMSALGTAFGFAYTCVAAYAVAKTRSTSGATWDRMAAAGGAGLAVGFVLLLCVPGMPAFMALPSWVALSVWVALGLLFWLIRVRTYSSIPIATLDHLILGRVRSQPST